MACLVDNMKSECHHHNLTQLVHNPMFHDLQATLASDCIRQSVPYVLVQGQSHMDWNNNHTNTDLLVEDATLQAEFRQLAPLKNPKVAELETFYNTQSATIMTHRSDALVLVQQKCLPPDQLVKEATAINAYYDEQQGHLTLRISKSLQLLKCMLPSDMAQPGGMTKKNKVRQLNTRAIRIMTEWYEGHLANPYPTNVEKEDMAIRGNISVSQVKGWFANKRNRSMNTKPKREQQKMQQQLHFVIEQLKYQEQQPVYNKMAHSHDYSAMLDNIASLVHDRTNELQSYDNIFGDLQM